MKSDTTIVTGIGYLNKSVYGTVIKGTTRPCADIREVYEFLKDTSALSGSIKYFGRFDNESRKVCMSAGLALYDADKPLGSDDTGIIATSPSGASETNFNYFKDYYDCGRTLGRGNLFIYTLPTSPLAEAAICYKLNGPLLYMTGTDNSAGFILEQAEQMINNNRADSIAAVAGNNEESVCFMVEKAVKDSQDSALRVESVVRHLKNYRGSYCDAVASLTETWK